jgi:hypothetical protein
MINPYRFIAGVTCALVLLLAAGDTRADWINFSGAENAPNTAEIHVEVSVADLEVFEELIPDDMFRAPVAGRPGVKERMKNFSEKTFRVMTDGGKPLRAKLRLVEPRMRKERPSPFAGKINPLTGRRIPGPPEDKRVLYAELIYPFKKRPLSLTFVPPVDAAGGASVSMGFLTYHRGVPINDFRYLSEPAVLTLNWEDPWYSSFNKKSLKRWQRGGVMSFLYIEPFEVRHEVLARVKDLEAWMDLGLQGDEFIEPEENEALRKRVGEFFLARDKVLIDGKGLRPILDRTAFVKYSMTGSRFLEKPELLPVNTAMVGVIITYLTDGIPGEVKVEWDLFSDRIQKVPTNAIDPAGPFPSYVTPDDNVHVWTNFLKNYTIPTVEKVAVAESVTSGRAGPPVAVVEAEGKGKVHERQSRPGRLSCGRRGASLSLRAGARGEAGLRGRQGGARGGEAHLAQPSQERLPGLRLPRGGGRVRQAGGERKRRPAGGHLSPEPAVLQGEARRGRPGQG